MKAVIIPEKKWKGLSHRVTRDIMDHAIKDRYRIDLVLIQDGTHLGEDDVKSKLQGYLELSLNNVMEEE